MPVSTYDPMMVSGDTRLHVRSPTLSPQRSAQKAPTLLRTVKNVTGNVEVKVFRIEGFSDGGMLDTTDPYVR